MKQMSTTANELPQSADMTVGGGATVTSSDDVTVTSFVDVIRRQQQQQQQQFALDVGIDNDVNEMDDITQDAADIQAVGGKPEADDDVAAGVTSVLGMTSVAVCAAAVAVLILLVFVVVARRKRLLPTARSAVLKVENPRYCSRTDSCRYSRGNVLYVGPTVSLKSRGNGTKQREIANVNYYTSGDIDDVLNDATVSSVLAGKYALYRPRPGKNVDHVTTSTNQHAAELNQAGHIGHITGTTCRAASELTFVYENVDKHQNLVASVTLDSTEGRRSASRPTTTVSATPVPHATESVLVTCRGTEGTDGRDSGFSEGTGGGAAASDPLCSSID